MFSAAPSEHIRFGLITVTARPSPVCVCLWDPVCGPAPGLPQPLSAARLESHLPPSL